MTVKYTHGDVLLILGTCNSLVLVLVPVPALVLLLVPVLVLVLVPVLVLLSILVLVLALVLVLVPVLDNTHTLMCFNSCSNVCVRQEL
jgi:hypothetical protein